MNQNIYLDNAATGFPKSIGVARAMEEAFFKCGNAGRSGYYYSIESASVLYECREALAKKFGTTAENVVLCHNATAALNFAIKGLVKPNSDILISSLEHNAVYRPAKAVESEGKNRVKIFEADIDDDKKTVENFTTLLEKVSLAAVTHASNVCGRILPINALANEAHKKGALFVCDASQTAGHFPISIKDTDIDVLCIAGHKGLYGPLGCGCMIVNPNSALVFKTIIEGGTGINSIENTMPTMIPERLEAGTLNTPVFAGLYRACEENVYGDECEKVLYGMLIDGLRKDEKINIYGWSEKNHDKYVPVLSIRHKDISVYNLTELLNQNGIYVRGGLHCAPLAHHALGTLPEGTVRISLGRSTTEADIDSLLEVLHK